MGQKEYVLDKNSLCMVIDVEIENDNAIITAILIPKKIWDREKEVKQHKTI